VTFYIILDFIFLLYEARKKQGLIVYNMDNLNPNYPAVHISILCQTQHLTIPMTIIGSLVLVFDHDRQNQSCSVSNSTTLALAVLLVFVPVKCKCEEG
jgi:hypothetical protein